MKRIAWSKLPYWLKGGITGAVLFLIIWNILFLTAYFFVIQKLWDLLFYIAYPIFYPTVKFLNFLFGSCFSLQRCFSRLPVIFILSTLIEGFILGAVIKSVSFTRKLYFQRKKKQR